MSPPPRGCSFHFQFPSVGLFYLIILSYFGLVWLSTVGLNERSKAMVFSPKKQAEALEADHQAEIRRESHETLPVHL